MSEFVPHNELEMEFFSFISIRGLVCVPFLGFQENDNSLRATWGQTDMALLGADK